MPDSLTLEQSYKQLLCEPKGYNHPDDAEALKTYSLFANLPTSRMAQYNRMMRSVIQSVLENLFPQTLACLTHACPDWSISELSEVFRRQYPTRHFSLSQGVKPFPEFVANFTEFQEVRTQFSFLEELAQYEWQQIELRDHPAHLPSSSNSEPPTNLATAILTWNPTLRADTFEHSIVSIHDALQDDASSALTWLDDLPPQRTYLLQCRLPGSHRLQAHQVNQLTIELLQDMRASNLPIKQQLSALQDSHSAFKEVSPDVFQNQCYQLLSQAWQHHWLLMPISF